MALFRAKSVSPHTPLPQHHSLPKVSEDEDMSNADSNLDRGTQDSPLLCQASLFTGTERAQPRTPLLKRTRNVFVASSSPLKPTTPTSH